MKYYETFAWFIAFLFGATLESQAQYKLSDINKDLELQAFLDSFCVKRNLLSKFDVGEDGFEEVSIVIINLNSKKPTYAAINPYNFIYPASFYKVFIAMEALKQVRENKINLYDLIAIKEHNVVSRYYAVDNDRRKLLEAGDTATIDYLIDLTITRSDNNAANTLIDVVDRENINATIRNYGWFGSEVTKKFGARKSEIVDKYKNAKGVETCAAHAAEFFLRIYNNELIDYWVSNQLKRYLLGQLDKSKISAKLPKSCLVYSKSGWWSYWTNDSGIVDDGDVRFIICVFLPIESEKANQIIAELARQTYDFIKERKKKK